jgi:hypothetical protein
MHPAVRRAWHSALEGDWVLVNTSRREFLRLTTAGTLAVLGSGLEACGPVFYGQIVRQTTPNPLLGVRSYGVLPVSWDRFRFNGVNEEEWLATRTPRQQASWANDKAVFTERLMERLFAEAGGEERFVLLEEAPPPNSFLIAASVAAFRRGIFDWTLQIRTGAGAIVDEVIGTPWGGGWGIGLSSLRNHMASEIVQYLRTRHRAG